MSQYSAIKAAVNAYIKANGRKEITGNILNAVLNATISSLGKFYQFAGVALPSTDPEDPDQNVCYLAGEPGTYVHFDNIVLENEEIALLFWNGEWTKQRMLLGIQEVEATVDNQVGTPSVDVSYSAGRLVLTFHNLKGETGNTGAAAGFGTIGADITGGVGTPGVSVESSGSDTAKNLMFHFTNLKGETGVTSVIATVDNTTGTPQCSVSLVGGVLTLAFTGLKGLQGDTGVSADYPITIVNNLTTNDPTSALSAAMGVQLKSEIGQLEAEMNVSFEGAGSNFARSGELHLLQGKKYRFTIETTPWPIDSTGSGEVSMFQITSVSGGVETNLAFVNRTNYTGIKGFYDVTVPSGSEYVFVGGRANSGYSVRIEVQLIDYILELNTKTQENESEIVSLSVGNYPILHNANKNAYINNAGKLTSYSGWMATDYIPIDGLSKVLIYCPVASNYNAWYSDKDENAFISQMPLSVGNNTSIVPNGAKYIRLSNTNAGMAATTMKDATNTRVVVVEESLDTVNDGLKNIGPYVIGQYVNNSTGAFETASGYKRTDYISISDYHGQIYFVSDNRTPYCCFYDSNKEKVGTFIIQIGETLVNIPEDAVYCAFSLSRYSGTITMFDSTFSAIRSLGFNNIFDIQPKYQYLTDILTQMIRKPLLLVFTDLHGATNNIERINRFYLDNLFANVWYPVNLGDTVEDQATDSIAFLDNELGKAALTVIGNHDVLVSGTLPGITSKQAYDKYIAPNVSDWGVTQPSGASTNGYNYYYKDKNYSQGTIRLIVLDEYFYDETQHNWFVSVLADANTNGYYVVVCQHQSNVLPAQASVLGTGHPFATPELGFDLYITTAGYSGAYSSAAENRAMAVDAFIGNGGKFICWMSGHTHSDQCHTFTRSNGKQLSLVFSNAGMSMTSSIRVAGYSSDCFQYVAFDLAKKYVYVLRIGESVDKWFHKNSFMCYDFVNHNIVEYY